MPLSLSIITPSYNQGPFIERTIQSVLSQNIPDMEYMICDGGSTDETLEVLRCYEDRLRWVSEKDKGQADAVNKGIQKTSGDIIGWLNSDDIYYPGALASVQEFFEGNPQVEVAYGDANHIDENDRVLELYYTEDWSYERLKDVCYLCQPAVFFRRRVVKKNGLLDTKLRYCMDYEYWLRLGAEIEFIRINQLLAGSRMYKSNKTMGSRVAVHLEIVRMTKKSLGQTPLRWVYCYAHVLADAKGFDRQIPSENKKYLRRLIFYTTISFLRFYHYIPKPAMKLMWEWTGKPLPHVLQKIQRGFQ